MDRLRRRLALLVTLTASGACTIYDDTCGQNDQGFRCSMIADESSSATDADACEDGADAAIVRVENRTGNAIEVVYFVRCDGTDASEFPIMPPGLPDGEDVELPLPGPGCWLLDYSGDGCEGETPHETASSVCSGDTYVWTVDDLNHVCMG
jgi:hypothetical protein